MKKDAKNRRAEPGSTAAADDKEASTLAETKSADGEAGNGNVGNGIGEPPMVTFPVGEPSAAEVTES